MTKLQSALQLAELGFYVFRVKRDDKRPYNIGWQDEATRDPKQLAIDFADKDFNIGLFADRFDMYTIDGYKQKALVIVDVDTKEGKKGNLTMQGLDALGYDFPPTFTAITASGGRHLFYWHDQPLKGSNNALGENVDVKSKGGYVLGAGSAINNIPYTIRDSLPVAKCPDWIVNKCGLPTPKAASADDNWDDSDANIKRGQLYIKDNAPEANAGNRNDNVYKTATWLRDYGISYGEALVLMMRYNDTKVNPPMPDEELDRTVSSAYTTATNPAGIRNPNNGMEFEADPDAPDEMPYIAAPGEEPRQFEIREPNQLKTTLDNFPLIEDMLDQQSLSILYGASNAGKTFIALSIAYHIATGKPWAEKRTTQGYGVYVAAEGGRSAENRIQALKKHYNEDNFPLGLITSSVNLFDSAKDIKGLIDSIEAHVKSKGVDLKFIVIDTLSRALAGGNENDSQDMGEFVKNVDYIRARLKCHLMIVHHTGKDQARGARGHSLLRAAVDTELEVADNIITTKKQRDMEFGKPIGFELEIITLGNNAYGKPITSCAVTTFDLDSRPDIIQIGRMNPRDTVVFMALRNYASGRTVNEYANVVDLKTWAKLCKDFDTTTIAGAKSWPKSDNSFNKAFREARGRLEGMERVVKISEDQWAILE